MIRLGIYCVTGIVNPASAFFFKEGFRKILKICLLPALLAAGCASGPPVSELLSLDEAIEAAAAEFESQAAEGSEIVVAVITASQTEIGDYLVDGLTGRLSGRGKLIPLAREAALAYARLQQEFQMNGTVSDASAADIARQLGAKLVISGVFDRYRDFSQLRLRAVAAETPEIITYSAYIRNNDPVLASFTVPPGNTRPARVSENALDHLNQGRELRAEDKFDAAIREFDRALAIDRGLAEAYFYRGNTYIDKGDIDRAIADLTQAIRINPNYARAYNNRGFTYNRKGYYDRAIADITR